MLMIESLKNIQFDYNSPVIISYLILSLIAWFLGILTKDKSNVLLFNTYRSSPLNPLTYIRLFTHSIGHADINHLINNFLFILLIGPLMEEKYGSINLLIMFLITSLVIGIFHTIFSNSNLKGASGNVYMLIVLSSFASISSGKIPLTVILIFIFYILKEVKGRVFNNSSSTYYTGHLLGALCGLLFGIYFLNHTSLLELINIIK